MLQVGDVNSEVSEQPVQGEGVTNSIKALNTTIGSYERKKDELSWLALLWYRALNEVSETGTEFRSPARTDLKTSQLSFTPQKSGLKPIFRIQIAAFREDKFITLD